MPTHLALANMIGSAPTSIAAAPSTHAREVTHPDTSLEPVTIPEYTSEAPRMSEPAVPPEIFARIVALADLAVLPILMRVSRVHSDLTALRLYGNILVTVDDTRRYPTRKSPFDGVNQISPSGRPGANRKRAALRHVQTMRIISHQDSHDVQEQDTRDPDFLINRVTPDIQLPRLRVIHSTQLAFCAARQMPSGGFYCGTVCPLLANARPTAFIDDPKDPDASWATRREFPRNCGAVPLPGSIDTLIEVVYPDEPYERDPFDIAFFDDRNKHFGSRLIHTFDELFPRHQPTVHIIFAPPPLPDRHAPRALPAEHRYVWKETLDFVKSAAKAGMRDVHFVGHDMLGPYLPDRIRLAQDQLAAIRKEVDSMLRDPSIRLKPERQAVGLEFAFDSLEKWEKETRGNEWDLNDKVARWKEQARAQAIPHSQA